VARLGSNIATGEYLTHFRDTIETGRTMEGEPSQEGEIHGVGAEKRHPERLCLLRPVNKIE